MGIFNIFKANQGYAEKLKAIPKRPNPLGRTIRVKHSAYGVKEKGTETESYFCTYLASEWEELFGD